MRKIYILVFALFTCLIAAKEMYAVCKEEADNISYDIIYVDNEDEGLKIKTIIYDIDEGIKKQTQGVNPGVKLKYFFSFER